MADIKRSIRVGVLTVSDRSARGTREDASGPALCERLRELGFSVGASAVVEDDRQNIADELRRLAEARLQLILTTGGTGLAPRDVTPEATRDVAEREVPGLMELARRRCADITPLAALSRGVAVTRGNTLIVNLPGHPRAALETLDALIDVLPHALTILSRDPDCELTGQRSPEGQA